jgi:3-oxoacyl-[acyl-carrier protein] reductase
VRIAIVGAERWLAAGLAEHLTHLGATVLTVGPAAPDATSPSGQLSCDLTSATDLLSVLETVFLPDDDTPALVRLGIDPAQAEPGDLASLDLADWVERVENPLRESLAFHQAAQRFLADRGGRVVVILPTVGLSGGPGFVPLATTAEADRTLVKAQSRVGGHRDITLNTIVVTSSLLAGADTEIDRSGLPPLALAPPDPSRLAAVLHALLGPAFAAVTGQTVAVDGGVWMAP